MKHKILKYFSAKQRKSRIFLVLSVAALGYIIAACTPSITSVEQEETVNAGDSAHMIMHISWTQIIFAQDKRLVVGVCEPKSWNGDENTTMHVAATPGNSSMSLIPPNLLEPSTGLPWKEAFRQKFGIGPNLLDDVEWVVFWSDQIFHVENQESPTGTVFISTKTSENNLQYKPGYAFCENDDGVSDGFTGYYTNIFGSCLEVVNGIGDIQDFCNPQIGIVEPSNATKNDILTFKYDGDVDSSNLSNESEIYLCITAWTKDGQTIPVCSMEEKSKLVNWGPKKWRLDMWPLKFFDLSSTQELDRFEYYFTNKSGSIKVGYANTEAPFKYSFKCE